MNKTKHLTFFVFYLGCRCVRFTSTFNKEWGGFTSPDYPRIYPAGIRCLLYHFQAPKDFIVHLSFTQISLPSSSTSPSSVSLTQSNGYENIKKHECPSTMQKRGYFHIHGSCQNLLDFGATHCVFKLKLSFSFQRLFSDNNVTCYVVNLNFEP